MILNKLLYSPRNIFLNIFQALFRTVIGALFKRRALHLRTRDANIPLNRHWLLLDGNSLKCDGCGACSSICPSGSINVSKKGSKLQNFTIDYRSCIGCFECVRICPIDAISKNSEFTTASFFEDKWLLHKKDLEKN